MALLNSYDSKLNKLIETNPILLSIRKATIGREMQNEDGKIFFVTEGMDVDLFQHPLYDPEKNRVYVDTRTYASLGRDGTMVVRNMADEQLAKLRAELEYCWTNSDTKNDLWNAFTISNKIFINWLTNTIARKFGLNPLNQVRLKALIAAYTIGLFYNGVNETMLMRQVLTFSKQLAIPNEVITNVMALLDNDLPRDLDEFFTAFEAVDFGPATRGFNARTLLNMLGRAWYINANALDIVTLALEYPPAFASLVYMASNNSMYNKSEIGGAVDQERQRNRQGIQNFPLSIDMLTRSYLSR